MSALIGTKGSKSALVGDGGRVITEHLVPSRTHAAGGNATIAYTGVGFTPAMLYCAGNSGTSNGNGHGIGHGFADTNANSSGHGQAGYAVGGNSITTDGMRYEAPYTTAASSTPVDEGQIYRMTGGGQYLWQARVNSMDADGFTVKWDAVYGATGSGCYLRALFLR